MTNHTWRLAAASAVFALVGISGVVQSRAVPDWIRFRGPNGSGISTAANVPTEFGAEKNLLWRLELPTGHSSPILFEDRIYVTAVRGTTLTTIRSGSRRRQGALGALGAGRSASAR